MITQLQEEKVISRAHLANPCTCEHCMEISRQQQESELNWLKEHQLFDR